MLKTLLSPALLLLASTAVAQTYTYDNGSTENGLVPPGVAETGFLHGFDSGAGDMIQEIRVAIGTGLAPANGLDGNDLQLGIWDDPNNDGNPSDAVLLYQSPLLAVSQSNTDTKVAYPIQPAVAVTGGFFVGIVTEVNPGEYPIGLDIDGFQSGENAYWFGDAVSIDLSNLAASGVGPVQSGNAVFLLDAIGGGSSIIGTPFCDPALTNSTGASTSLRAVPTAGIGSGVRLLASAGPPTQFGYMLIGGSTSTGVQISQGLLCLGTAGGLGRYNLTGTVMNSLGRFDASGAFENLTGTSASGLGFDVPMTLPFAGSPTIQAGATWNFQLWHRESAGQSNFSNGLTVVF